MGPQPKILDLPKRQWARLQLIQDAMTRAAQDAFQGMDEHLAKKADELTERVWAVRGDPKKVKAFISRYYASTTSRIERVVVDAVADAATFAKRYDDELRAYAVQERHRLVDRPTGSQVKQIEDTEARALLENSGAGARARAAYDVRQAQRAELQTVRPKLEPVTRGDRLALRGPYRGLRPFEGQEGLSKDLHGASVANSREAGRVMVQNLSDLRSVQDSARELQRQLKQTGQAFGGQAKTPAAVQDFLGALRRLQKAPGSKAAKESYLEARQQMEGYSKRRLKEHGTTQSGYQEFLQRTAGDKWAKANVQAELEHWTYWKQRYMSERYIATEQATAFRVEQLQRDRGKEWVVGYRWVMAGSLHSSWLKRKPGNLKKFGGKHCICEELAGEILSKVVAENYPNGGHPHCRCSLVPVYDESKLLSAPNTAEEEAWYEREFGSV